MELTPAQKYLIHWLKVMGVQEDDVIGIMLLMDTPKKRDDLMCWMAENRTATSSDIIGKAMDIEKYDRAVQR